MTSEDAPRSSSRQWHFLVWLACAISLHALATVGKAGLTVVLGTIAITTKKLVNHAFALVALFAAIEYTRQRIGPSESTRHESDSEGLTWLHFVAGGLALALGIAFAWGRSLDGGFIREDLMRIRFAQAGAPLHVSDWLSPSWMHYYRQTSQLLDCLDLWRHGLDSWGWRLTNLILHFVNAVLLYILTAGLLQSVRIAFLAAMLFAWSPISAEPVSWISGRDDLLATTFSLCASIFFVRSCKHHGTKPSLLSTCFFLACLFTKESTLSLPLGLCALSRLACPNWSAGQALKATLAHWVVLSLHLLLRAFNVGSLAESQSLNGELDLIKIALLPLSAVGVLAFPVNMEAWADFAPVARVVCGVCLVVLLYCLVTRSIQFGGTQQAWLYVWCTCLSIPVYRMIHLSDTLQNGRYLYLPAVGFSMLAAVALERFPSPNRSMFERVFSRPLVVCVVYLSMARVNAEPWVAVGAVAKKVQTDLAVVADRLKGGQKVHIGGLPSQYRGAYYLYLTNSSEALMVHYGLKSGQLQGLSEEGYGAIPHRVPDADAVYLRWMGSRGFVLDSAEAQGGAHGASGPRTSVNARPPDPHLTGALSS